MPQFKVVSDYKLMGDQPQAVEKLVNGIKAGKKHQTLMGVTGSGKTFTMANIIEQVQKPTLVISHNKTLAAQLPALADSRLWVEWMMRRNAAALSMPIFSSS